VRPAAAVVEFITSYRWWPNHHAATAVRRTPTYDWTVGDPARRGVRVALDVREGCFAATFNNWPTCCRWY